MLLKALPLQLISLTSGLIIKRGCTEVSIEGENAGAVMQLLLDRLGAGPATAAELGDLFAPDDREAIADLLIYLLDRRLLVDVGQPETVGGDAGEVRTEGRNDVFFWHFGLTSQRVAEKLTQRAIAVVGVNRIALSLVRTLSEAGVDNIRLIDYAPLRNLQLMERTGEPDADGRSGWPGDLNLKTFNSEDAAGAFGGVGCIVAASDFGGWHLLERWNQQCIDRNINFLPVLLENLVGWIGPLVAPGRTACLACLRARIDSNLPQAGLRRVVDQAARAGKAVSGGHAAMADMLGIVAAMELLKFYNNLPGWQVGRSIELNLLTTQMTSHRVLRVPRCRACSGLNLHAALDPVLRAPIAAAVPEPAE